MQQVNDLLVKAFSDASARSGKMGPGDYTENGIVHCGKCKEPKQESRPVQEYLRGMLGDAILMHRPCACDRQRERENMAKAEADLHQRTVGRIQAECIKDARLRDCTFAADDQPDSPIGKACRRYVAKWDEMSAKGIGIMFMGEPGGGKTFYAAAIANALIEREVYAYVTTIPDISTRLNADYGSNREKVLDWIAYAPLLILDDYGFERSTSYGMENAYTIINARYTAKKPLIITTNLTQDEMSNPPDTAHSRIMSRLKEMCVASLKVTGSHRDTITADKRRAVMGILFGED